MHVELGRKITNKKNWEKKCLKKSGKKLKKKFGKRILRNNNIDKNV